MEKIKTIDALFAKEFIFENKPRKTTVEFGIEIKKIKMDDLKEISLPIQPISQIINPTSMLK